MNRLALLMFTVLCCSSCATIKIYQIDRQTVLEDEAAGEWPEFEKEILQKSEASTPTPFPVVAENSSRARLFNVLNGELTSSAAAPAQSKSSQAAPAAPAQGK